MNQMRSQSRADVRLVQMVRVEEACPLASAAWERDERSRFCEVCRLDVHNLSAMTSAEAAGLMRGAEGRVCVRYARDLRDRPITADRRGAMMVSQAVRWIGRTVGPAAALLGLGWVVAGMQGCETSGVGGEVCRPMDQFQTGGRVRLDGAAKQGETETSLNAEGAKVQADGEGEQTAR